MKKLLFFLSLVLIFASCEKDELLTIPNDKEYKVFTETKTLVTYYANGQLIDTLIESDWSITVNDNDTNYLLRANQFKQGELTIIVDYFGKEFKKSDGFLYQELTLKNN